MAAGLLEVDGTIDVAQFWPTGGADADTTSVKVNVAAGSFRFRPHAMAPFRVTHAFDDAKVRGAATYDAIRNGKVIVRLQGIDAPELHYRPSAAKKRAEQTDEQHELYLQWNLDFRQPLAETSTMALGTFFSGLDPVQVPCVVRTAVDTPDDVFDTYGRLVGDIVVQTPAGEQDVNHWLASQGWVLPAFYASMSESEIATIIGHADAAYFADRGVWPFLNDYARTTDFELQRIYRGRHAVPDPAADTGLVVVPKLFRRLAAFVVNRKAKMVTGTFEGYLRSKRSSDTVHLLDDFLSQGPAAAPVHFLDEFVASGFVTVWPEQIVFREKPSRVVGPGGTAPMF